MILLSSEFLRSDVVKPIDVHLLRDTSFPRRTDRGVAVDRIDLDTRTLRNGGARSAMTRRFGKL